MRKAIAPDLVESSAGRCDERADTAPDTVADQLLTGAATPAGPTAATPAQDSGKWRDMVDNFKLVNDSLGHSSGDDLLCEMAMRISACAGDADTVGRFGGDELVILHPRAVDGSEAGLGARILAAVARPANLSGKEVVISASVGVALCSPGTRSSEQLLREADTALYAAKGRGRARVEYFNEELHARAANRMQTEATLSRPPAAFSWPQVLCTTSGLAAGRSQGAGTPERFGSVILRRQSAQEGQPAMHQITRSFCLMMAAASFATAAPAADATPPQTPATPAAAGNALQELDEIMVRGKKLKQVIADAEDEFFSLFNNVNTDDDYDTGCSYLNLNTNDGGSQLKSRVCMPGFVADAMAQWAVSKVECTDFNDHDGNFDGRISRDEADADDDLKNLFIVLDKNHDQYLSAMEYAERNMPLTPGCYQPPPPQLVLMEGTQKWYDQSMKVINSDPRLQKMAGHLDDLYRELYAEESKLNAIQAALDAGAVPAAVKPNTGPRAN